MTHPNKHIVAYRIKISGLIQGVGFRPFINRCAEKCSISGKVYNTNANIELVAEGIEKNIQLFIEAIKNEHPPAAFIKNITTEKTAITNLANFSIEKSVNKSDEITQISPDIAVCEDCLSDMKQQDHRIDYPFINCTNCGPRFTIINNLPYDRTTTTMAPFTICDTCKEEYQNINNRRYHAQPVACNTCGPHYTLIYKDTKTSDNKEIIRTLTDLIDNGEIIAFKGIGGFNFMCDANNEVAVKNLRSKKLREGKPFAVMTSSIEKGKTIAHINTKESELLASWQRPIVILNSKEKLAPSVSNGFSTVGIMLPYMPIHYSLFDKLTTNAVVLTSGNISDEPIEIEDESAINKFKNIADAFLIYNREIYNRTDDSVSFVINDSERLIRRSRGYVPTPIYTNLKTEGIFAAGAELVNCFGIGKANQVILSQHIGDLKNYETYEFYTETYERFKRIFRFTPELIVHDMHPDYLSTKFALEQNLPTIAVQHHHAHIASCMVENNLDEKVIGVSFDGTGYGSDGNIWGGEFFVCNLETFDRYTHFDYKGMPGGDKATYEPWRMALSYLLPIYGKDIKQLPLAFLKEIAEEKIDLVLQSLEKNINCTKTSSAGRLFDAVSAIVGICTNASFHAEAPMRLEAIIDASCKEEYNYTLGQTINFDLTMKEIVEDIKQNNSSAVIATKFHNTIISIIFTLAKKIHAEIGINKVILSGGTFQNKYITEQAEELLQKNGFEVYSNKVTPVNDGSIALGQLAIAAKKRSTI